MDILLQLQSTRKFKAVYVKISDIPCNTINRLLTTFDFESMSRFISEVEESLDDNFYFAGIVDAFFCKRKVSCTYSYSDFTRITRGLGETSSIV